MASVLKINGSTVSRPANRIVINGVGLTLEGVDQLAFTERAVRLPGSFYARQSAELIVDGTTVFKGEIVGSYYVGIGRGAIDVGYRALGMEWQANRIQITAADGSGGLTWNLPRTDLKYQAALAGKSVGAILTDLFDLHASDLTAMGVTSYDPAELALLTAVPNEPVYLAGGLWNGVRQLLFQWCNKYACWIDPSDGKIHVKNQLTLPTTTLTLDSDPFVIDSLSRDNSECFTKVVNRGAANIQAAYLTLTKDATLTYGWTGPKQASWTYSDYLSPKNAADVGAVTSMSSTTLTVTSDNAARAWITNYWSPLNAEVVAYDPAATGIAFSESRRIVSNTSLTAGGSSILTIDSPFSNSGYTRYSIRGLFAVDALTWRKLDIVPTYVAQHLVPQFSHAMQWSPQDGMLTQTSSPQAVICWSNTCTGVLAEFPATFQIVPYDGVTNGYIVFDEPILKPFGTLDKLKLGGASVDGVPCEIKVMVPYSVGALTAQAPSSGWQGTAYTVDGLQKILYVDYPQWTDYKDAAAYATLAQERLDTVKDTVIEGSLTYYGKLSAFLVKGRALNIAAATYTTGFESANAPVRSVFLDYVPDGGAEGAGKWATRIQFSNRMKPFAGDRLYTHPAYAAAGAQQMATLDLSTHGAAVASAIVQNGPQVDAGGEVFQGKAEANTYKKPERPSGPPDNRSRLTRQNDTDKSNAAKAAKTREKGEASNVRQAQLLQASNSTFVGPPTLAQQRTGPEAVAADDRENQKRAAESGAKRDASRLSNALGNPMGPRQDDPDKPGFQTVKQHESDRDADAMLANLMRDEKDRRKPGGSTGRTAAYP